MEASSSPFTIQNKCGRYGEKNCLINYKVVLPKKDHGKNYPVLTDSNWEKWTESRKTGSTDQKIYYAVVLISKFNENYKEGGESWVKMPYRSDAIKFNDDGTVTSYMKISAQNYGGEIDLNLCRKTNNGYSLKQLFREILPGYIDIKHNSFNVEYKLDVTLELRELKDGNQKTLATTTGDARLISKTNANNKKVGTTIGQAPLKSKTNSSENKRKRTNSSATDLSSSKDKDVERAEKKDKNRESQVRKESNKRRKTSGS